VRPLRLTLLAAPIALAAGCLLPAFETLDDTPGSGGDGGAGGTSAGTGGTEEGGAPNQGGEPNAGGQAGAGPVAPLVLKDDVYVVLQDNELSRIASQGVLANDSGEDIRVTGVVLTPNGAPESYAPEFEVESDGSFSFVPAAEFFGAFEATYQVSDAYGNTGKARVTIYVQPREAAVTTLADGVGGFCVEADGGDGVGSSIAAIGDADGDGYDDFVIGAPEAGAGAGRLYVVRGSAEGESFTLEALTPESDERRYFVIDGAAGSNLGAAVSGAGDLDGDGLPDFLAGAPGTGPQSSGAVYSFFSVAKPPAQAGVADAAAFSLKGEPFDAAGNVLGGGFDLDDDGTPDPVVAVRFASPDAFQNLRGLYYAIDGATRSSGPLSGAAVGSIHGTVVNDSFTLAASSVGDVTGDGDNDLLLVSDNVLAVVKGPASDFPMDLGASFVEGDHGVKLARTPGDKTSVAEAGDVDGDGVNDVLFCNGLSTCKLVFGPVEDLGVGLSFAGFSGSTLLTALADLTGDGASEALFTDGSNVYVVFGKAFEKSGTFDVTKLPNGNGFVVIGETPIAGLAPVGDVNGDGYQDLAFGVPTAPGTNAQVCVLYGTPKAP
jgi:hypothetical protein